MFFSSKLFAQDAVVITITPRASDLEYIASFSFSDVTENLYDSVKAKFRVQSPPTGNTTVSITGATGDWIDIFVKLRNDPTALKSLCTNRIEALLRAVNQSYLTNRLDAMDSADQSTFTTMRAVGRFKLRRQ